MSPTEATVLTVEHHVAEGGAMLPRVGSDSRQRPHVVVQLLGQHNVAEISLNGLQRFAAAAAAAFTTAPTLP